MHLSEDLRAELRLFAFYLANRALDAAILPSTVDYTAVFAEPSALEMVFAIWSNVISLDEAGKVENSADASRRAAQYIRSFVTPDYRVDPPLQDWETQLWL